MTWSLDDLLNEDSAEVLRRHYADERRRERHHGRDAGTSGAKVPLRPVTLPAPVLLAVTLGAALLAWDAPRER